MQIDVIPAALDDKPVLANLMQLYLYDFSEFAGWTINRHGLYDYRYLDHYWTEPDRYPFLLQVAGELAGFALVRSLDEGDEPVYHVAEFFIMRTFRRTGHGEASARQLFYRFPGQWSISQLERNEAAQRFWRAVIGRYTGETYTERIDERGHRIQEFVATPDERVRRKA